MFQRLFGRERRANQAIVGRALFAQSWRRRGSQRFYSDWDVPDTPLGRFEMLALHMFLFLHRMRGEAGDCRAVAQELTDTFFLDVDHSLRELGIGDIGVPKRMKKLARMFYGRAAAYAEALEPAMPRLTEALARNVRPEDADWPQAAAAGRLCRDRRQSAGRRSHRLNRRRTRRLSRHPRRPEIEDRAIMTPDRQARSPSGQRRAPAAKRHAGGDRRRPTAARSAGCIHGLRRVERFAPNCWSPRGSATAYG